MRNACLVLCLLSGIDLSLGAETWTGSIVDSASGAPLGQVSVGVYDNPATQSTTGNDGKFSITSVTTALHRDPAMRNPIQMRNGVVSWIGGGDVSIRVYDMQGKVRARFLSGGNSTVSSYSLPNLPKGDYSVKIDLQGLTRVFNLMNLKEGSSNRFETLSTSEAAEAKGLAKAASASTSVAVLKFSKNGYATKFLVLTGASGPLQVKMQKASVDPASPGLPPMPEDVKHRNTHLMFGNIGGVAVPIQWSGFTLNFTKADVETTATNLHQKWDAWSHHKVNLVGRDGSGSRFTVLAPEDCQVPYPFAEQNGAVQATAQAELIAKHNLPAENVLKWFLTSGTSTPNSGGTTMDTWGPHSMTPIHELGHLFRLGHGNLLKYNADGSYNSMIPYGDRTTYMGDANANGFNLPNQHRLNWIEEDEVKVFKKENPPTVYRIRNIHNSDDRSNVAGVVYYLPVTGNRMWISVNQRGVYGSDYLGNQLALTKYVTGWHDTPEMLPTVCINHMVGAHTDDYGLTYELVAVDQTAKRAWADIRISYNPANEINKKPLVFKPTLKVLTPISSTTQGKMEVTLVVTNPNGATTTPCIQQMHKLTVPNAYRVTLSGDDLPLIIPGGASATVKYIVESKKGAAESTSGRLRGEFQFAHLYPFTFDINF